MDRLLEFLRAFLINLGQFGTEQMCAGFLHEVEIPVELNEHLDN